MSLSGAKLPEGKTCGECVNFKRCSWLVQCSEGDVFCDFSPSKFATKKEMDDLEDAATCEHGFLVGCPSCED